MLDGAFGEFNDRDAINRVCTWGRLVAERRRNSDDQAFVLGIEDFRCGVDWGFGGIEDAVDLM